MSKKITVSVHDREVLHPLYGEILLHVAASHDIGAGELASPAEQLQLRSRHRPSQFFELIERLCALCPDPYLPVKFGELIDLTAAGVIGQAVMSAATVGDSIRLIRRYYPLTGLYFDLSGELTDGELQVSFDVAYEEISETVRAFLLEALVNSWGTCFRVLRAENMPLTQLLFDFQPAAPAAYYREAFGVQMRGGANTNLGAVNERVFAQPTVTENAVVHGKAVAHCEAALLKIGAMNSATEQVRRELRRTDNLTAASLDVVAGVMSVSGRTLNRRLGQENASFKDLLDEERRRRACRMLQNTGLNIDQIGGRLGYSDVSNFRRAFKKWTGQSPNAFRRSAAG